MDFLAKLNRAVDQNNSLLCVGLDPDMDKLPAGMQVLAFNKAIIDATADLVCAFKPNSAFYEARGAEGITELQQTCDYIHEKYPDMPILLDFKRGDIGNTNNYYAHFAFEQLNVDTITIHPYFGKEASEAFLAYKDKGIIILCKSSNPGSGEIQDLLVDGKKLYLKVAENVRDNWNANGNCHIMVGATYPEELAEVRSVIGEDMVILVPGIGTQGGDIETTVKAGINKAGKGVIISSSRAVLYASNGEDFAEAARQEALKTRDEINKYRS